jgi:hypothetical protein
MPEPYDPIASLWRFDGTVTRQTYALVGFIGFAIKHNIDRYVARDYLYGIHGLLNYWLPSAKPRVWNICLTVKNISSSISHSFPCRLFTSASISPFDACATRRYLCGSCASFSPLS